MKYRLIKKVNNMTYPVPQTRYVIEKRLGFLFIKWWSQNYLFNENACYSFDNEEAALKALNILNGKKEWYTKTVIV